MDSEDTVISQNVILAAINDLRQEMNQAISGLRQDVQQVNQRLENIESRIVNIENEVDEIKKLQFSFDVRLERLEAMADESLAVAHQALNVAHNARADLKVLRAEVMSWTQDVKDLHKKSLETFVNAIFKARNISRLLFFVLKQQREKLSLHFLAFRNRRNASERRRV